MLSILKLLYGHTKKKKKDLQRIMRDSSMFTNFGIRVAERLQDYLSILEK